MAGTIRTEHLDCSRPMVHREAPGIIRGSGRRCRRPGKSRLLRVECLEDRTLLSVAAGGADELGLPVSTASIAAIDATGGVGGAGSVVAGAVARPNLTPYKPAGWGDKIVVSNVTGTNTASALSTTDTLYVDWAALNNGARATSAVFFVRLFVDGVPRNTWSVDPPLDRNTYTFVEDFSIGQLGAGQHTIRIKLDPAKAVAESNEYDNAYSKTIWVRRPNLTPYRPSGWSDKIVVSSTTGTHAGSTLYSNNTLYVDWAGINNGKVPTAAQFSIELYVDGSLQNTWVFDPPLRRNTYTYAEDFAIGPLSAGKHTVRVKLDTTKAVAEGNEKDNVYAKTITVLPPVMKPNLTPYRPADWSDKIVVSTGLGTHTDATDLLTSDRLYIDWAGINNGNVATGRSFTSRLYVDGTLRQIFNTPAPLDTGSYAFFEDVSIGPLNAGKHTIQIRLDTGSAVGEINEKDNVYTRTITVASGPSIAFAVNYTDSAGEGFFDPQLGAQRRSAFEYALGIWTGLLAKAYEGEKIAIDAAMNPMGGSPTDAVLGSAGPENFRWNFGAGALANTVYGEALANHLAGRDLSPGVAEISARFNSDVDNPTVLGSTDWYYGTDGAARGDIDFVTVVLHEVGHGLNFLDLIDGATGAWSVAGFPGIYDRFLEIGDGTNLTGMTNAGRRSAIVSNNLYWNGSGGIAGNGGERPRMYAPNPHESGSSVSHTDETVHTNDLMSPTYSGPDHTPGPIDLGILADMGWGLTSGASSALAFGAQTSVMGESSWAPFGALIQERYVLPSPRADAALSGAAASRDWLAAVDWVLSRGAGTVATVGCSASTTEFHSRQRRTSLVLAEHPTDWSRLRSLGEALGAERQQSVASLAIDELTDN